MEMSEDERILDQSIAVHPFATELPSEGQKVIDTISEDSRQKALQIVQELRLNNRQALVTFGMPAQSKLLAFSNTMLDQVQRQDIGEIGEILTDLIGKLNEVNPDELTPVRQSFFARWFRKKTRSPQETMSRFQKASAQIDRISVKLSRSKNILLADIVMLDRLYEHNKEYFHMLNIYIAAGELKLEELHANSIPTAEHVAKMETDPLKKQELDDILSYTDLLEKRVYDLKISREITLQSAPQIRLIQHTNQLLVEKIQSSIMTAIPLWKNQMSIALSFLRQNHAASANKQVSEKTEKLFVTNNELEKLAQTHESLRSTLAESLIIQAEGNSNRQHVEQEFRSIETALKQKLSEK
ncbi:toxic anion resistance protein [Peribacillus loiseleuriae]|uniref:toxic anion resistance protein n=1 Tax=Peribacillus loiseleuriae TaxID=1679170 RepID=UPI003D04DE42